MAKSATKILEEALSNPDVTKKALESEYGKMVLEFLGKIFEGNKKLHHYKGLDAKNMDTLYSLGYQCYESGRFKEAETIFQKLCWLDHMEAKYFKGLAATYQKLGQYESALKFYGMVFLLDDKDPTVLFYSGYCNMMLKEYQSAKDCFQLLIDTFEVPGEDHKIIKSSKDFITAMDRKIKAH